MVTNSCREKVIAVLCVVALAMIFAGCRKKTDDQADQQAPGATEGLVVEIGVGIGPVKFGMSKGQIVEHFGEPNKIEGRDVALDYISSKGLGFLMHPLKGLINIDCWSDEYPFPSKKIRTFAGGTKEGVKMGASRKGIEAAYGKPSRVTAQGELTMLQYDDRRAIFTLKANRLVKFSTYAPN